MRPADDIQRIASVILKGGVAVIPTDTIYGFACLPDSISAVRRIMELKGRSDKPFLILDPDISRVRGYYEKDPFLTSVIDRLTDSGLWPGRITLIGPRSRKCGYSFLEGHTGIAVRYTDFEYIRVLTEILGSGLVSTSCNTSGGIEENDPGTIRDLWKDKVDAVSPEGTGGNSPSVIIRAETEAGKIRIVRAAENEENSVTVKMIGRMFKVCH